LILIADPFLKRSVDKTMTDALLALSVYLIQYIITRENKCLRVKLVLPFGGTAQRDCNAR
jgi:hypothetical protein